MNTFRSRVAVPAQRDERLTLYLGVAAAAVCVSVFGGHARTMVIAVPFLVAVVLAVRPGRSTPIALRVTLGSDRCLEGDTIEGLLEIAAPDDLAVEVLIDADTDALAAPVDRPWAWEIPVGVERPVGVPFTVEAHRWGDHPLGSIRIRLIEPGTFLRREAVVGELPAVSVLPRAVRSASLTTLRSARATAGAHRSTRPAADGYEFAEVHPYRSGDRLRDLNWAATLRRDEPHVNRRVPELAGDLVIVVDTFPDALRRHSAVSQDVLTWTGRTAWSLALAHLDANDRVGIAVEGSKVRWMSPQTGRRARQAVYGMLLALSTSTADRPDPTTPPDRVHLPAGARVLAITPLARRHTVERLNTFRATGHEVDVMAIDVGGLLAARSTALPDAIMRLRQLQFDERVASVRRNGIRVRVVRPDTVSNGDAA